MSTELWTEVDRYLTDLIVQPDDTVLQAREAGRAAGMPGIEVSPNQGKLLMVLAIARGARRILEIGTLAGFSTIWLARALPAGGCLITIEAEAKHAEIARTNIERAGVSAVVELREGCADEILARLVAEGQEAFDLIFIDADKPGYVEYFDRALQLSRPGTVIFADNVVRKGAVADPGSEDPNVQGVRRFNERLAAEPRVVATAMQTVGSKGHDGFALAVVVAQSNESTGSSD
jgi:predicted O-methyltransferase YrrM